MSTCRIVSHNFGITGLQGLGLGLPNATKFPEHLGVDSQALIAMEARSRNQEGYTKPIQVLGLDNLMEETLTEFFRKLVVMDVSPDS
jgi:hypothetical protein